MRHLPLALLLTTPLLLVACKKGEGEGDAGGKDTSSDKGKADSKEAADGGGEQGKGAAQTCPAKLEAEVSNDVIITKDCGDVAIEGTVYVYATLTLEPGARLVAADGAQLIVGAYDKPGKLISKGTAEAPVVMTSKGDQAPGVWVGVRLDGAAARSQVDGLVIENAGSGEIAALEVAAPDVTIGSLTVRKSKGPALDLQVEASTPVASLTVEEVGMPALRTTAQAANGVVAVAGEGAQAHIVSGRFDKDAKLAAIGVPWVLTFEASVEGNESTSSSTLTVAAGADLRFTESGALTVGYYNNGKLVLAGEAGKEVKLGFAREPQAAAWRGIFVAGKGTIEAKHAAIADAGKDEHGAIQLDGNAKGSLSNLAISKSSVGVRALSVDATLTLADSRFSDVPLAIDAHPAVYGGVGSGNTYEGETKIGLSDGQIAKDIKWSTQGATVELRGNVDVDNKGKLSVAGGKYVVADGVTINVAYYETATIELKGTVEQPVEIAGTRDEPQLWGPITLNEKTASSVIEHVVLRSVAGTAGVVVNDGATVKIDDLRCDRCAATLSWGCTAKLEKANVSAGADTAAAEVAPEGCD